MINRDRTTLLESSRDRFLSTFDELIEDVVHKSIEALYQKAEKSTSSQEQRHFLDARSFIAAHEKTLISQIKQHMNALLEQSFQTSSHQTQTDFSKVASNTPMALVDINAFEDDLRLDALTNRFRNETGEQLRNLNIRIAILFGHDDIIEYENPFRPYLLTQALMRGVETMQLETSQFVIVTDQFAEELLPQATRLYEEINTYLSDSGIAAQLQFKPRRSPSDVNKKMEDHELTSLMQARQALMPDALQSSQFGSQHAQLASPNQFARIEHLLGLIKSSQQEQTSTYESPPENDRHFPVINSDLLNDHAKSSNVVKGLISQTGNAIYGWLEGMQKLGDTLRHIFLHGQTQHSKNDFSISPQLTKALHSSLPAVSEMVGADGGIRNLLLESRDGLTTLAADRHEKMTIDIVAMLFEFILKDHQVPAEVRAQLGRLQFCVLKMALMDADLLSTKNHPVRLLVNRIGSISVGLQKIDPTGERISAEICSIVEALLARDSEGTELFTQMLDQLDVFIARELLASTTYGNNDTHTITTTEHRIRRFEQDHAVLEKLFKLINVPIYLQQFLMDTWLYVIERAGHQAGQDVVRFRLVVPQLLWSILPKASEEDHRMLLQMISELVPTLREGMSLLAWHSEQIEELINWLAEMHIAVVRDAQVNETMLSLDEMNELFYDFVCPDEDDLQNPALSTPLQAQRLFIDEAYKELEAKLEAKSPLDNVENTDESLQIQSMTEMLASNKIDTDDDNTEEDILDRLRSGVMVEINLSGIPTMGRLNWISPNASNLILTMNGQETHTVISVRMFRRMLKNSHARFVEVAPLFERAVQSLLESADLVDLTHSS